MIRITSNSRNSARNSAATIDGNVYAGPDALAVVRELIRARVQDDVVRVCNGDESYTQYANLAEAARALAVAPAPEPRLVQSHDLQGRRNFEHLGTGR